MGSDASRFYSIKSHPYDRSPRNSWFHAAKFISFTRGSLYRIGFSSNMSHYKQQCCKFWFYWSRWKKLVLNKVELLSPLLIKEERSWGKKIEKDLFFSGAGENHRMVEGMAPNFEEVKINADRIALFPFSKEVESILVLSRDSNRRKRFPQRGGR